MFKKIILGVLLSFLLTLPAHASGNSLIIDSQGALANPVGAVYDQFTVDPNDSTNFAATFKMNPQVNIDPTGFASGTSISVFNHAPTIKLLNTPTTSTFIYPLFMDSNTDASETHSMSNVFIRDLYATITHKANQNLAEMTGLASRVMNAGSGTITDVYGAFLRNNKNMGTGSIINNYGMKIDNQTVGTNNWALYTLAGAVHFGDHVDLAAPLQLKGYTVATLPTCHQGDTAFVTDATSPTYLGVLVGGGSVVAPAFCNGTNWVSN